MPDVVTFDPDALTITEVNSGLDNNETDLVEIYSEWKDWLLADPTRLGYPPAFRQVGADPISDIQNLGATFFLNVADGWRFKAADYDHRWQINGNCFSDPDTGEPGLRLTESTPGRTIEIAFFVSNLVDSSVARLDLNQLLQAVYVDVLNGVAGTTDDVGTPTNPVNNLADAVTIAAARTLNTLVVRGNLTIDRNMSGFNFVGENGQDETTISLGGFDFDLCNFRECALSGTMTGAIQADHCQVQLVSGVSGSFGNCGLLNDFTVAAGATCVFHDCYSEVPGDARVVMTFGGANTMANFRNYSGGLELTGLTTGCVMSFDGDPGKLVAGSGNTGGTLLYRGSTTVDLTGIGNGVTLVDDRFGAAEFLLLQKLLEADHVFDKSAGLLYTYERGTTTQLVPPQTVVGESQNQDASITT